MNEEEVQRLPDWGESGDVDCLMCGKTIHLYFNGGELDQQECCGLTYRTECQQIDLVITRPAGGPG